VVPLLPGMRLAGAEAEAAAEGAPEVPLAVAALKLLGMPLEPLACLQAESPAAAKKRRPPIASTRTAAFLPTKPRLKATASALALDAMAFVFLLQQRRSI